MPRNAPRSDDPPVVIPFPRDEKISEGSVSAGAGIYTFTYTFATEAAAANQPGMYTYPFNTGASQAGSLPLGSGGTGGGRAVYPVSVPREQTMSDPPTREEIDAKLAAAEARSETRFTELSGKIDRVMDAITANASRLSDDLGFVKQEIADVKADVKADNKWTRWTIIIAVVTSIIAGIGALWVTQGNMLAAFQAGLTLKSEQQPAPPSSNRR